MALAIYGVLEDEPIAIEVADLTGPSVDANEMSVVVLVAVLGGPDEKKY